ncbi:MAG: glycosyltransferase [Chloroflexi bacterium]|nr:glycosyltransferase [Chloroflexota bacterium]
MGPGSSYTLGPHQRGGGKVGFISAYHERKNPEMLHGLVRALPDFGFLLIGRGWGDYPGFNDLASLPNFKYVETSYEKYPEFYRQLDVFVSVSHVDGGPIPLLETMMCNVVPVSSSVGFAPDVIRHGENGFLFDEAATIEEVAELIRRAYSHTKNVAEDASQYSWRRFTERLYSMV